MLSLRQTQWLSFKIYYFTECLFQFSLHNLKRSCIHGTVFCDSGDAMRKRSRNKKQFLKKIKLQAMAALTNNICNKAISKGESTKEIQAEQRSHSNSSVSQSDVCCKQRNSRSRIKESTKSGKEANNDKHKSNVFKQSNKTLTSHVNSLQQTSNQNITSISINLNRNLNVNYQNTMMFSSLNVEKSQNLVTHPSSLFLRSFSDSRAQQQHLCNTYLGKNEPTNNHYNRNSVRRSSAASTTSNRIRAVENDKQLAWALRSWQRTPFGKKLGKKMPNSKSCMFTVMSYNVLAQELLTEHSYLYSKHHPRALLWEQRWNNLLVEIKQHDADILCLQEVQSSHIDNYFNELKKLGYDGVFKERTGHRTDGCAIYYKISMFNLVEYTTVEFNQSNIPVLNRDNVAIVAKFSPKNNQENEFVVATTHLLYNPRREDVRLAQTQVLLSEVDRIAFKKGNRESHQHLPIIITGDFNLTPDSSVYDLITRGILQYEHLSNKSLIRTNTTFSNMTGKLLVPSFLGITDQCQHVDLVEKRKENIDLNRDEELEHVHLQHTERYGTGLRPKQFSRSLFSTGTLTHDLALKSAYEHRNGDDVEATTFQDRWITVDYIFYSGMRDEHDLIREDKLKLISRYTVPTGKQLHGVKIPNFAFGSDHLSLIVKFKLNP